MQVTVSPRGSMDQLSKAEIQQLQMSSKSPLYQLYRRCSLAVLSSGAHLDNAETMLNSARTFDINILCVERGIKIELINPPKDAFVDGKIMRGIQEHLFSVLRDVLFLNAKLLPSANQQPQEEATNLVFDILRHARALSLDQDPNLIVCWGGHSINEYEYNYTKEVGYQLGLRELDICTGCGPGAMKGPMKGASIGHAKQRYPNGRFIGLTEPSIIAAEPPNQIVNHLIILPDIEKRLEAFVRMSHGIIIFPGGVGTAEELLYLLGIKLNQKNQNEPLPMVLTGPKKSEAYFKSIDNLVAKTLGKEAQAMYEIIIDDPIKVAQTMRQGADDIKNYRKKTGDSFQFNWGITIDHAFQTPFIPTHENMSQLDISKHVDKAQLAATLRQVFSGIVAGNVKSETVQQIEDIGRFQLHGEPEIMQLIDKILQEFVAQGRMKLPGSNYEPCYDIL
ncbi:MAG: LOG family protein [Shewanellaceae bacterium]|nr:LOG family protein [Shewanellaceae bacterium]